MVHNAKEREGASVELESVEVNKKKGLPGSALKWVAVLSMFIDHASAVLIEGSWIAGYRNVSYNVYLVLRGIGRLAFPIYCFLLVEGLLHTRNVKKYLGRLLIFALISDVPFDLAFTRSLVSWDYNNVFLTLFFGLLGLALWRLITEERDFKALWWRQLLGFACIAAMVVTAELLKTDYGGKGVAVISLMYLLRAHPWPRDLGCFTALYLASPLELAALPDVALFRLYNGERGRQSKYFFYIFYPAHLLILSGIRWYLWKI